MVKTKFKIGQVVAECYLFPRERKPFIRSYFSLSPTLADMYNHSNEFTSRDGTKKWIRPLNKRERG